MQKLFKSKIFIFILGFVSAVGITSVFAYSLIANDVGFTPLDTHWEVDNVKDALDDLRSKKNNLQYYLYLDGAKVREIPSNENLFTNINCEENTSGFNIDAWNIYTTGINDYCKVYFNSLDNRIQNSSLLEVFKDDNYNNQIFKSSSLRQRILLNKDNRNTIINDSEALTLLDKKSTKVPTLSSDTNVVYGSRYDATYSGYRAFDGNNSTRFASPANSVNGNYIGYNFNKNISVYKVYWMNPTLSENIKTFKIQYYDGSWKDATTTLTASNTSNSGTNTIFLNDIYVGSQWRIYIISSTSSGYVNVVTVQFYGVDA